MFSLFNKTPEQRVERAIGSVLTVITKDLDGFTERQQATILKEVNKRFVKYKNDHVDRLKDESEEIKESLKLLKWH